MQTALGVVSVSDIHEAFARHELTVTTCRHGKNSGHIHIQITAVGRHEAHGALLDELLEAPWVESFEG